MNRRHCLGTLLYLAATLSGCGDRPNVILVSIDTLRPDHLGVYGYPRGTSPHIDALARESMVFDQAIAHAPSTLSSHASILTSLLPQHHGASVGGMTALAPEVLTLAEVLKEHGYATASFNGGVQLDAAYGIAQGFDVYESVRIKGTGPDALQAPEDRLISMVGRALEWIESVRERPFFLFLHSYEVHHPYTPQDEFWKPTQEAYDGVVPRDVSVGFLVSAINGEVTLREEDRQRIVDAYDAEIRSADAAVGELIEQLRRASLLEDTVVIVTSDHGEEFGERGWMGWHSHTLYDELLRVPLLIRLPRAEGGGQRIAEQVRGIDVAPTVLSVLGIDVPPAFAGRSLLPWRDRADVDAAVSQQDTGPKRDVVSLRTEEWKLYEGRLYHLANDPGERRSVRSAQREVGEQLEGALEALLAERDLRAGIPVELEQPLIERLRALGYLRDDVDQTPPARSGLAAAYYLNADWQGEPVHRRVDPQLDFDWQKPPWPLPPPFSIEWTGTLEIERDGDYEFVLESDDGSILEIDDRVVVDNGGDHPIRARSGSIRLSEGTHPVRIRYFNRLLGGVLRWKWRAPGGQLETVPARVLRPARGDAAERGSR